MKAARKVKAPPKKAPAPPPHDPTLIRVVDKLRDLRDSVRLYWCALPALAETQDSKAVNGLQMGLDDIAADLESLAADIDTLRLSK
jgi:hypothetical protein